jgi:hypothetical protein
MEACLVIPGATATARPALASAVWGVPLQAAPPQVKRVKLPLRAKLGGVRALHGPVTSESVLSTDRSTASTLGKKVVICFYGPAAYDYTTDTDFVWWKANEANYPHVYCVFGLVDDIQVSIHDLLL